MRKLITAAGLLGALSTAVAAQAQVSAVAVNPNDSDEVWVANRGNESVSVIDTSTGTLVAEIGVGVYPRSLAFNADGTEVFVANQRGDVPVDVHFVTPFTGTEDRGTVSVIDVGSKTVSTTLSDVGTEPYGVAVAPNGKYFAVTGFRSSTVKLFSTTAPYGELASLEYEWDLSNLSASETMLTADTDLDFVADLGEPRGFSITADSSQLFVTHNISPFISRLDVTLDGGGNPTALAIGSKFSTNTYPHHPVMELPAPTPVQILKSQGLPRFQEDIAISPDGTRALIPALLHNTNHDVNHDFGPGFAGDFANRVYPALQMVDLGAGANANVLHHELSDDLTPAEYVPYGGQGNQTAVGITTIGGSGSPTLGGTVDLEFTGIAPGDNVFLAYGTSAVEIPIPGIGTVLTSTEAIVPLGAVTSFSHVLPANPAFDGASFFFQIAVVRSPGNVTTLSNGVEVVLGTGGFGADKMGYRAGHPARALYNAAGDRAILLNRGSEDVFLYEVNGDSMELMTVFPPRHDFVERTPLDQTTAMGDLPMGMAFVEDTTTVNDDGILYIVNESTPTLSKLWIDFDAGVIQEETRVVTGQISTLAGADKYTLPQRIGQELFEDASRAQTAGNFNNSCASCHFEGGADGNVWQRPAGPRSTMPVYGGPLLTGTILWKGVRMNMGETGPMFGGENGGHGILTDAEQEGLREYHKVIPVPLNPFLDEGNGNYVGVADFGKDLFFGLNDTGLNPTGRRAGCADCHTDDDGGGNVRGYTLDFLDPVLTDGEVLGGPGYEFCIQLNEGALGLNIRNVNSGADVDFDMDGTPDPDRNNDGYIDTETYTVMNPDAADDFTRDDPNSYDCYNDPYDINSGSKLFTRDMRKFVIPTKLGVFTTPPYFHDHAVATLRTVIDPEIQNVAGQYGDPSFPGLQKLFNGEHDIRGHEQFLPGASKVQLTLQTLLNGSTFDADIQAILEYVQSL